MKSALEAKNRKFWQVLSSCKGASINHMDSKGGGRGYPNNQFTTQALFSESVYEGRGVKNTQKSVHVVYGWTRSFSKDKRLKFS